jgi:hypothetical protein
MLMGDARKYMASASLDRAGVDCGSLKTSQSYGPPRPDTGVNLFVLLFIKPKILLIL